MTKLLSKSIIFLFLASCSHKGSLNVDSFSSVEDLKSKTTSTAAYLSVVSIDFTPLTPKYLEAKEMDLGKRNMDTAEVVRQKVKEAIDTFSNGKSCFSLVLKTVESLENASFKNWKFKINQNAKLYELTPLNTSGVQSVPDIVDRGEWLNTSYACTTEPIDFSKPFTIHSIPQLKNHLYEKIDAEFN